MKPTPAQAILLRELSPESAFADITLGYNGRVKSPFGKNLLSTTYQRFKPQTVQALLKAGWLVQVKALPFEMREKLLREHQIQPYRYILSESGRAMLASLKPEDFILKTPELTAEDITRLLAARYPYPEWAFFAELYGGTGVSAGSYHRMDAWAMNCYPSKDLIKLAFEIKIYRSDFLKELADPEKRAYALSVSNQFYFVTGPGVIQGVGEVPPEAGWMEVRDGESFVLHKPAPVRPVQAPSWMFIASLARELSRLTQRAKGQAPVELEVEDWGKLNDDLRTL